MPILTAYWGAECKYDTPRGRLNVIFNHYTVHLFSRENINAKLCLRPLSSITELELKELAKVLDLEKPEIKIELRQCVFKKTIKEVNSYDDKFIVYGDNDYEINCFNSANAINYLRFKNFCVDDALEKANLVEWKQTN